VVIHVRTVTRSILAHGGSWWSLPVSAVGWFELRRGALAPVVAEARNRTDLPVHTRLRMVRWASAVGRDTDLSGPFRPGPHVQGAEARTAAIGALRERARRRNDHHTIEQLVEMDQTLDTEELLGLIRSDVSKILAEYAIRPKRGAGVDPNMLMSVVGDVVDRLEARGIRPFLMSGTLLGFVREGTFLEHDHDVDLGLLPEVDLAEVMAALDGSDLELVVGVEGRWIIAVHESGLHIDLFHHELRDGLFWHRTQIHRWWNTPFELTALDNAARRWWVPDDTSRYLDENYGAWQHPVVFYDISFDTPNRRYVDSAVAIRYLYATCLRALQTGNRWVVESAARELRDSFGIDVTENLAGSPLLDRPLGSGRRHSNRDPVS